MFILSEIPTVWLQISLVGAWLGVILLVAEGLNRFTAVGAEVSRKVVHIGTGNVILLAWWLQIPDWVGISAGFLAGAIALISYQVRKSFGTFFYAVSISLLVAWFWPMQHQEYAALGILVMTWGDGLAAVIGQKYGKHLYRVWGMQKSWEGSATMYLVSFAVSSLGIDNLTVPIGSGAIGFFLNQLWVMGS
ncbi:MAG: phosphatidate cytidylyltransferase [Oscillatoriales cyanobacterium]|nr:MAG: phosphatidate cytidylyltransferase [Oscillatoriales cyanobacterium]